MAKKILTGFGERLRALREAAGLTQAQLAERADVHLVSVSRLENGQREPPWAYVLLLADALGVSTEAFRPTTPRQKPATRRKPGRPRKPPPTDSPQPAGG